MQQRSYSPTDMACERKNFARFAGRRSISGMAAYTSVEGGIESVHPLHGPELRALRHCRDRALTSSQRKLALRLQRCGSWGWSSERAKPL